MKIGARPPSIEDALSPGDSSNSPDSAAVGEESAGLPRTRERVAALLLERGRATAAELGEELGLGPAAIRRHLEALMSKGYVAEHETTPARRGLGRGRPAKIFSLTPAGRRTFPHAYDGLAAAALRYLARVGGNQAVADFAAEQFAETERRCREAVAVAGPDPAARTQALAAALTREGYAADASKIASGGQLCQHHCPVAEVAAEFPQLCEVETAAISRLLGSHVQRLSTIAHGDGVCTTHIPGGHIPVGYAPAGHRPVAAPT